MIPRLFEHNETAFTSFGIGALKDAVSCEVSEERNGIYELILKYPITGSLYSEIKKERIIYTQVNDNGSLQAFRIYRITAPLNGIISIYAQHISYDLSGVVAFTCNFTNSNPNQILSFVSSRKLDRITNFTFFSDISNTSDFAIEKPRSMRNVIGGSEDSLITTFGGELEFDNFSVKLMSARGSDNGISIIYGKNLTNLEQNSDISAIYSHLCPFAKLEDGDTEIYVELSEKVLPITTTLEERKVLIKDFSSYFGTGEDDLKPTEANLRMVASNYLLENILGIETPNITLSFAELTNQLGYQNLHERVKLCDVITVKYPSLGVNIKTKIVKTIYNSLKEKYESLTLGAIKTSLTDKITSIENKIDNTDKEVKSVPNHIKKAVDEATDKITGATGGCVVLDLDSNKKPYELLIMDDDDKQNAQNVWRWNIGGLGFSPNGYNGPYTTAFTNDGHIVANFIDTGTLNADILRAGTIEALTGDSYWNLETGNLYITGEIDATSGSFSHVTIDNTCSIYGYLWLEGSLDITTYMGTTHYDFDTRVGGDEIASAITETTREGAEINSNNYILPLGDITIPGAYTNMSDVMQFGIARDKTFRASRLIAGLHMEEGSSGTGSNFYRYAALFLKSEESNLIYYYNSYRGDGTINDAYCQWGSNGVDNILVVTWYTDNGKAAWMEHICDSTDYTYYPLLNGRWYINDLRVGSDLIDYQYTICLSNDRIKFMYGRNESGRLETFTSYVDIKGTWRTNGNSWISSSDIKLKNSIEDLKENYSSFFDDLRPRSYKFNDGRSGRSHTGFIAQEMRKSLQKSNIPLENYGILCAFGDPDDPKTEWGIRYEELIALCVNEIQKLKKEIKTLKEENK